MPPWTWMGWAMSWTTSPSGAGGSSASRFSATVRPVTVRQSPCSRPASSSSRITTGTPPIRSRSAMWYLPWGLVSARWGTRAATRVEVVEGQFDPGLVGDGQQMEHGIGRPAEGHGDGDGVLERLLGHDLAGPDAGFEQRHHGLARREGGVVAPPVDGRRRRASRQRHAQRLGHRRHGVGGEHPGARSLGRAGVVLDEAQLLVGEGVDRVRAHRLEHRGDVEGPVARPDPGGSTRRRGRRWAG